MYPSQLIVATLFTRAIGFHGTGRLNDGLLRILKLYTGNAWWEGESVYLLRLIGSRVVRLRVRGGGGDVK